LASSGFLFDQSLKNSDQFTGIGYLGMVVGIPLLLVLTCFMIRLCKKVPPFSWFSDAVVAPVAETTAELELDASLPNF
jgi:hypothetical protein